MVALARALLGTDHIACWNAHYFCKEAVADATERIYHRDYTGWPFSPMRNVSIWLALDDVTDNGPIKYFAGSHLAPLPDLSWQRGNVSSKMDSPDELRDKFGEPVLGVLRAGQAIAHSEYTAHLYAGPNLSGRRRLAISITYIALEHDGVVATDCGTAFGEGVVLPQGARFPPGSTWSELKRPRLFGPPGFPEPAAGARL